MGHIKAYGIQDELTLHEFMKMFKPDRLGQQVCDQIKSEFQSEKEEEMKANLLKVIQMAIYDRCTPKHNKHFRKFKKCVPVKSKPDENAVD
jgi:hypothetical protein